MGSRVRKNMGTNRTGEGTRLLSAASGNRATAAADPASKVETVVTLAEGIADDFNNILTAVMGACTIIDKAEPDNGELRHCVELIRTSAERAADLSDKLKHAGDSLNSGSSSAPTRPSSRISASSRDKNGKNGIVSTD